MPNSVAYIAQLKKFKRKVCAHCQLSAEDHIRDAQGCCTYSIDSSGNGYPKFYVNLLQCKQKVPKTAKQKQTDLTNRAEKYGPEEEKHI